MNGKYKVTVEETSMTGYSLPVIRKATDPEHMATVSQLFPTAIAEWIASMAEVEAEFTKHLRKFVKVESYTS
jgi:hypothetical protein